MVLTTPMLMERLSDYGDPFGKIKRLCREGKLHQVTKGLYETDGQLDGRFLCGVLYGPSYISFNYALAFYGLIPEKVCEYTCATCGKGKKKTYRNDFGDYFYRDIPTAAFPFETRIIEKNGYMYSIASPEKALCDKLYELQPVGSQSRLKELLFDDLRIDTQEISKLDPETVAQLSPLYHSKNVNLLAAFLRKSRGRTA